VIHTCSVCKEQGHNSRSCPDRADKPRRNHNVVLMTEEHGEVRVPQSAPFTRGPLAPEIDALETKLKAQVTVLLGSDVSQERFSLLALHLGQAQAAVRFFRTVDLEAKAWL
jgi:hypothetical protein